MADGKSTFQMRNGCAACKHTSEADPGGTPAAALGKSFWCRPLAKAVDARDGSACAQWEIDG